MLNFLTCSDTVQLSQKVKTVTVPHHQTKLYWSKQQMPPIFFYLGASLNKEPLHIYGPFTLSVHLQANEFKAATCLTQSRCKQPNACPVAVYMYCGKSVL